MPLTTGHYAVVDRRGRVVGRYSENRLARLRAMFMVDAQILWVTGRLDPAPYPTSANQPLGS